MKKNGKDALAYVDGVDCSGQSNQWSLNIGNGVSDASGFGDDWDVDTEGTANWNGSLSGWDDLNGADGITDTLFGLVGNGPFIVLLYPAGNVADSGYWYGVAHTTGVNPSVSRGATNTFGFNFKGTGPLLPFGLS